jgi:hypothetical protein
VALDRRRKEDRPVDVAEFRAALPLPEIETARAAVDAVAAAGREIATEWEAWATETRAVPPRGSGLRRMTAALRSVDPVAAFDVVVDDFARLAALEPGSIRDLGSDEVRDVAPGAGGLANLRAGIDAAGGREP